jgi:RNA polymerase sigma-70 factor (ECF subfamily)
MKEPDNEYDQDLLRRLIRGEEEAFTLLFRRRQPGVYRFALEMSGRPALAEEVTQEVFMVLMRDGKRYDSAKGSVSSYLYGIARNLVLRFLEKDRAYVSALQIWGDDERLTPNSLVAIDDPLGDLTCRERIELVREAVLALPAGYREVVILCDLHEHAYLDAASVLGCSVGTVRSRLHRARALLLRKLQGTAELRQKRCSA